MNGGWELQDAAMGLKRAAKGTVCEDNEDQEHVVDEYKSRMIPTRHVTYDKSYLVLTSTEDQSLSPSTPSSTRLAFSAIIAALSFSI